MPSSPPLLLPNLTSPRDLDKMSLPELERLADEIRNVLCNLVSARSAHFASNLGVVELAIALHQTFDFLHDRLIWDTGHQIYPHKLLTGRYAEFQTIRTKGGLMGYPNPNESDYDLFCTGHAGSSISTALGLASGDELARGEEDRWSVAVIGDGAFPSGVVYEALNNAKKNGRRLLVVLNDNEMSICPRVGGMGDYLDRLRMNSGYVGLKEDLARMLGSVPLLGDPVERFLVQVKEAAKAGLSGGMFFEDLGMRYFGPIDGHNIALIRKYLRMARKLEGPVLLHLVTEKGHGFRPAAENPVLFHAPPQFQRQDDRVVEMQKSSTRSYTTVARDAIADAMERNDRVTVMTAAMCQGNKLEPIRDKFPQRFFDTGICEAHAVTFAAGQAKAGLRPIVNIYSTFLQRSFDHIFQEVALQNLPVTFMLDRGGLSGPDGKTHHGVFDIGYQRIFPNMVVMAPGDQHDLPAMLDFALQHTSPCSIRYPKAKAVSAEPIAEGSLVSATNRAPVELGQAEVFRWGHDGTLVACGTMLSSCLEAAAMLEAEGLDFGVVNARFIKPLDESTLFRALRETPLVVTVEEGALGCGFGSALLEAANTAGVETSHLLRLGIPDAYVEHGERSELLADLGLDTAGIVQVCRQGTQARQLA